MQIPNQLLVPIEYWRLVRGNRNFRRLWGAQVVSEIGDWFYTIAIYSLLLHLTGRAGSVALALVLQVLPQTFTGPISGVINDRLSRKRVMIAADLCRAAIVLSMLLVRTASMVWLIYVLLFLETVLAAFFEPARSSVIPNITEREQLTTANTLSSATWSFNLAIGSALGGVVGLLLGRNAVFILNAVSFLISAVLIASMRFVEPHLENLAPLYLRGIFTPIVEGARYIKHDSRRLVTVMAKAGAMFMATSWVMFPIMGERIWPIARPGHAAEAGMLGLSMLMTARGAGALIGPLFTAGWVRQDETRLRQIILLGYIVGGLGYMALSAAPSLALACLAVVFAHCGGSSVWVHSTTLLQLRTDDAFRGRVFAAELGIAMASLAVLASLAGFFIDHGISVRVVAVGTGIAMLIPALLWALTARVWHEPQQQPLPLAPP